jgi:hypothetical protein
MFNLMTPYMGMPGPTPGTPGYSISGTGYATTSHREHSSSPIEMSSNIHTFCNPYGIDDHDEKALNRLGFVLGDNLNEVTELEYKEAGFKPLAWKRVLKAYKKYKHNLKQ